MDGVTDWITDVTVSLFTQSLFTVKSGHFCYHLIHDSGKSQKKMECQKPDVKPVLYSFFRSSSCWRVRIALDFKEIDYEYKTCEWFYEEGQKRAEYLKLNPMGEVPTLIIDGNTLTQSLPIIEYLEETRPDKPLLPKDPVLRAKARALTEIINSGIQPLQNIRVEKKSGDSTWAKFWIEKGFTGLERALQETAGRFSMGDSISLPDVYLVPQVYRAKRVNVDMSKFPLISRIDSALSEVDAFKSAHALRQPDCPMKERLSS
ncbi:probable maleylacetoacetate isomerase [Gigantopelta aegis]|uniref:probable maleylacetoacetate isomerase n=1 Tax=Gigantopelta aegis TaxID=1735272 RepID=UPI001B888348|nr:probable maleylacetoacetate isomerase [Gigantopelta aegis]